MRFVFAKIRIVTAINFYEALDEHMSIGHAFYTILDRFSYPLTLREQNIRPF